MKTQRRTIYIADDGSEHVTKKLAAEQDLRIQMNKLLNESPAAAYNEITPADAVNILLENGTYKFNK